MDAHRLVVIRPDPGAELVGGLLEADRRRLAVDGALAEQQDKLLAQKG